MVGPGSRRRHLSAALSAAYGDGLLSDATLSHRLEQLLDTPIVDPERLVGDLTTRRPGSRGPAVVRAALARGRWPFMRGGSGRGRGCAARADTLLLALDWSGHPESLIVGRDPACDVVLGDPTVSRRHAALHFRDGHWILQDLGSRNGSSVNRRRVMRCRLAPGDRLVLGEQALVVD
jgi:hypothetical protein